MSEDTPTCRINEGDVWPKCDNLAMAGDPDGLCILHSHDEGKDPGAFREALRAIWDQEDQERYNFSMVFFPGPFDLDYFFDSHEFKKPVNLFGVTFTEVANFSGANFTREAVFSMVTFTKGASFSFATFEDGAYFAETTFLKGASFFRTTFSKESQFLWTTFMEEAEFTMAIIDGRVIFQARNPAGELEPPRALQGRFRNLEFSLGAVLRFQSLSLAETQFAGTDLRRVEFHHVQWHPYRGRQAIYEEVLLRQKGLIISICADTPPSLWTDSYGEVERLYRDLQENYEKARDYKRMGDFHYGEMEMHRLDAKWHWFPFYWYNLYWLLSGYGERPSRALGWLAGFLLALPLLVWGVGLDRVAGGASPGFLETFTYIFEKATFQRPPLLANLNLWGRFISNLSLLIIPGQAALFLLALRNRLGRRR